MSIAVEDRTLDDVEAHIVNVLGMITNNIDGLMGLFLPNHTNGMG